MENYIYNLNLTKKVTTNCSGDEYEGIQNKEMKKESHRMLMKAMKIIDDLINAVRNMNTEDLEEFVKCLRLNDIDLIEKAITIYSKNEYKNISNEEIENKSYEALMKAIRLIDSLNESVIDNMSIEDLKNFIECLKIKYF